jgi:hypothetical protein
MEELKDTANDLKNDLIRKKAYFLRKKGMGWRDVQNKITEEFNEFVSEDRLKKMYDEHIAKALVISQTLSDDKKAAFKVALDWDKKLEEKFMEIDTWTHKLMTEFGKVFDEAVEAHDQPAMIKLVPTLLAICKEILNQLYLIKKQQEQIIVDQKNVYYNPQQIYQVVNQRWKDKEREEGFKIHPLTGKLVKSKDLKKKNVLIYLKKCMM